jgi:WD40 repeat protein
MPLPPGVIARIGSSRLRQASAVGAVAVAPDGKTLASVGYEGVRIWETTTGNLLRFVPIASNSGTHTIAFSADGRDLLWMMNTWPQREFVRLDVATGREQLRVTLPNGSGLGWRVALSSRRLAYVRQDKSISICDTATGRELQSITGREAVAYGLTLSPDDRSLAVADHSDTITIYDTASGTKTGDLKRDKAQFRSVVFSPDGRTLAAINSDDAALHEVHLWDFETRRQRVLLLVTDLGRISTIHFSRDSKTLVTCAGLGGPILWDTTTGQKIRLFSDVLATNRTGGVFCTAFTTDGKTLIGGTGTGTLVLWDVATGRLLPPTANPVSGVEDIRFSSDGRRVIGRASRFLAWDAATGREVERFAALPVTQATIALSPDHRLLATASEGVLRMWDAATGQEVRKMNGAHLVPLGMPVFTPDGRRLIVAAADANAVPKRWNWIAVWDVATGQLLGTMTCGGTVWELLVSSDGRWLAANSPEGIGDSDQTVRVFDLTTYQEARRFAPHLEMHHTIALSPDSRRLAAVGWVRSGGAPEPTGQIQVWDIETGREVRRLTGLAGRFISTAFSADGRTLATGSYEGTIQLWEIAGGEERHRFTGHAGYIDSLAFAPDGRTLAAASYEAPVYVWDMLGRLEPSAGPPTLAELEQAWAALAGADAKAAFQAIRRLVAAPEPAVAFLREKLPPAVPADAAQVRALVRQLDSPQFGERQQATQKLEKLADAAAAELRAALKGAATLEVRLRLQQLVDRIENGTPETLRAQRAVEALEYIGTPAVRQHLRTLAGGAAGADVTDAAAAALRRLGP